ncbi:MAG: insulinase family protein [Shewanellaceae bacterium]|nr:insulinase family protein [Shewanellaceae bacterium]
MNISSRTKTKALSQLLKPQNHAIPSYQHHCLANGLNLILMPDQSQEHTHINITYPVGSRCDALGYSGAAHLLEHLLFQGGTSTVQDYVHMINQAGGVINGMTSRDTTSYYQTVPWQHLETSLWLESDRLSALLPTLTPSIFERQQQVVQHEKQQHLMHPLAAVHEQTNFALYGQQHPYSSPVMGWATDLPHLTLDYLKNYFVRQYTLSSAALVVGGRFDEAATLAWIQRYFGWFKTPALLPQALPQVHLTESVYVTMPVAVSTPALFIKIPTVPEQHPDAPALDMLACLLGGDQHAWLQQRLVGTQVATQVQVEHFTYAYSGEFRLYVAANIQTHVALASLEAQLRQALTDFSQHGVTTFDLQIIQAMFKVNTVGQAHNIRQQALQAAQQMAIAGTLYSPQATLDAYAAVTPVDVLRVFMDYVYQQPQVVTSIVPAHKTSLAISSNQAVYTPPLPAATATKRAVMSDPKHPRFARPKSPPPQVTPTFPCWQMRLNNGIDVIGTQVLKSQMTSICLKLQGGIDLELNTKAGVAMLTTMLLHDACHDRQNPELPEQLALLGSDIDVSLHHHDVYIQISSLTESLPATLAILKQVLTRHVLQAPQFNRVKQQLLNFVRQQGSMLHQQGSQAFNQLLFGAQHRYAIPLHGDIEMIKQLTMMDVQLFFRQQYQSRLASLVVESNLPEHDMKTALGWLASWTQPSLPAHDTVPKPPVWSMASAPSNRIYIKDVPHSQQVMMMMGRLALPYDMLGDYFKAHLANYPLGGTLNSRLNQALRHEAGYTYGVQCGFKGHLEFGIWQLNTVVEVPDLKETLTIIEQQLAAYQATGMTDVEFTSMRLALVQQQALAYETSIQRMKYLAHIQRFDLPIDFVAQQDACLDDLSADKLRSVCQAAFNPDQHITLLVGNKKSIEAGLPQLRDQLYLI